MSTIPTQNPVPSEAPKDLKFNSGKIDEFVTSLEHEYKDRFGRSHMTIEGMRWIFDQLIERFKVDINQAIIAAGYITMDSFQQGAEITKRNEILRDEATGEYYRWDGDLPKAVPVDSTPESAGGIGIGAWVSVGDASLNYLKKLVENSLSITMGLFGVNIIGELSKGAVINNHNDAVYDKSSGDVYLYTGDVLPFTIDGNLLPDELFIKLQKPKEKVIHFSVFGGKDGRNDGLHKVAHDYCNKNNLILSYEGMNLDIHETDILVTEPVIFKCKLKIIRDAANWGKETFLFRSKYEYTTTSLNISYGNYSDLINGLSIPEMSYLKFTVNVPFEVGGSGNIDEHFVHISDGTTVGKSWCEYAGGASISHRNIDARAFNFDDIEIEIDEYKTVGSGYYEVFSIKDLDNINIRNITLSKQSHYSNPKSIFSITDSFKVNLSNINFPGTYSENGSSYGYFVNFARVISVSMDRISANRMVKNYWTMYGAGNVKGMHITNSQFYRYDNHSFVQDVFSQNVTTRGAALSGNGYRKMHMCDFVFTNEESVGSLLFIRGFSGNSNHTFYKGDVDIIDCSLDSETNDMYLINAESVGSKSLYESIFCNLKIERLSIKKALSKVMFFRNTPANIPVFNSIHVSNCDWSKLELLGICRNANFFKDTGDECKILFSDVILKPAIKKEDILNYGRYSLSFQPNIEKLEFITKNVTNSGVWITSGKFSDYGSSMCACITPTSKREFYNSVLSNPTDGAVNFGDHLNIVAVNCDINGTHYYSSGSTGDASEYITKQTSLNGAHIFYGRVFLNKTDAKYANKYTFFTMLDTGSAGYITSNGTVVTI
ncbi:hypothetical protein JEP66_11845 [Proteus mirabilis]|uniref:tail fiber/spike domain-containing protein n=1 Tax=Proteus mirabilis TaxID=584 RepID=UPI001A2C6298|nr:hypothetical protein [Proteus mirabilis]MBI6241920.1 hypothetical protein [Proteus mirabilis]MCI9737557.1 hypothetical protein [Proteus mirabilis]MCI9750966.1 hypothetical protein [Proteus mirabilis]MCI9761975.1 hypothetical protein [Proteus mirabilis]MCI9780315.1 hypothetical protein [Proteus mirabilis]